MNMAIHLEMYVVMFSQTPTTNGRHLICIVVQLWLYAPENVYTNETLTVSRRK